MKRPIVVARWYMIVVSWRGSVQLARLARAPYSTYGLRAWVIPGRVFLEYHKDLWIAFGREDEGDGSFLSPKCRGSAQAALDALEGLLQAKAAERAARVRALEERYPYDV